jgi:nitronate monooxygenase
VNRIVKEIGPMNATAPMFPLAATAIMALRAVAEKRGNTDFTSLWAGQNVSGCKEMPAGDLTRELAG